MVLVNPRLQITKPHLGSPISFLTPIETSQVNPREEPRRTPRTPLNIGSVDVLTDCRMLTTGPSDITIPFEQPWSVILRHNPPHHDPSDRPTVHTGPSIDSHREVVTQPLPLDHFLFTWDSPKNQRLTDHIGPFDDMSKNSLLLGIYSWTVRWFHLTV